MSYYSISNLYLFEVHHNATLFHHWVLLVVIHQVSQGVEPLSSTHIVLTILPETNITNSTESATMT